MLPLFSRLHTRVLGLGLIRAVGRKGLSLSLPPPDRWASTSSIITSRAVFGSSCCKKGGIPTRASITTMAAGTSTSTSASTSTSISTPTIPPRTGTGTAAATPPRTLYKTAALLVIADEVLNGKITDTNSPFFSRYCFQHGLILSRIETIQDSPADISSTVSRLSSSYDFVVTSGGIGPTHDDVTYPSIAAAFGLKLELHRDTVARMKSLPYRGTAFDWDTPSAQLDARLRMALLPSGPGTEYILVDPESLWVPIVVVNFNVYILPGIPALFESLLESLAPVLKSRGLINPDKERIHRIMISTPLLEAEVAEYLTILQHRVDAMGVKVGSYPRWQKDRNTVTLVGKDLEYLEQLVGEVEREVQGRRVGVEGEDDSGTEQEEGEPGEPGEAKEAGQG